MLKGDILIAEDDPVLRNLYVKKFSIAGFATRTAANGNEALEEITKHHPDVLILDIHMPEMDGFHVLANFPEENRPFPIILLTNFDDEQTKNRGRELGADGYFVKKDMTIRKLLEMVNVVLEKNKSQ